MTDIVYENMGRFLDTPYYRMSDEEAYSQGPAYWRTPPYITNLENYCLTYSHSSGSLVIEKYSILLDIWEPKLYIDIEGIPHSYDFTFDQNGHPIVVWEIDGNLYMYWYNPVNTTTEVRWVCEGITPKICIDTFNEQLSPDREIFLVYVDDGKLYGRRQSTRFDTPVEIDSAVGVVSLGHTYRNSLKLTYLRKVDCEYELISIGTERLGEWFGDNPIAQVDGTIQYIGVESSNRVYTYSPPIVTPNISVEADVSYEKSLTISKLSDPIVDITREVRGYLISNPARHETKFSEKMTGNESLGVHSLSASLRRVAVRTHQEDIYPIDSGLEIRSASVRLILGVNSFIDYINSLDLHPYWYTEESYLHYLDMKAEALNVANSPDPDKDEMYVAKRNLEDSVRYIVFKEELLNFTDNVNLLNLSGEASNNLDFEYPYMEDIYNIKNMSTQISGYISTSIPADGSDIVPLTNMKFNDISVRIAENIVKDATDKYMTKNIDAVNLSAGLHPNEYGLKASHKINLVNMEVPKLIAIMYEAFTN